MSASFILTQSPDATESSLRVEGSLMLFNAHVFCQKLAELFTYPSTTYYIDLQKVSSMSSIFIGYIIEHIAPIAATGAPITIIAQKHIGTSLFAVGVNQYAEIITI